MPSCPRRSSSSTSRAAGFDVSFLSFLEVDVEGNVNVSKLGKKPYLTAGCGGFVDITAHARKIVFSGWFEAGARDRADGRRASRVDEAGQVHQDGRGGGACDLLRRPRAGAGAGGALCHRTLRDPADGRRAWSRPRSCRASTRRATSWRPAQGRVPVRRECDHACRCRCWPKARWGGRHERGFTCTSPGAIAELRLDNPGQAELPSRSRCWAQLAGHLETIERSGRHRVRAGHGGGGERPSARAPTSTPGAT